MRGRLIDYEIKSTHIFSGEEPDDFCVKLEVDIGIEGVNGSEIFKFTMISPKYLGQLLAKMRLKLEEVFFLQMILILIKLNKKLKK